MCVNLKLDSRLRLCAEMVTKGSKLIDIGTDHAYLPIWLVLNNIVSEALAVDVKEEPLKRAVANIKKYKLEDKIKTRISNGFENIKPFECETVVIAGMGAETIASILDNATWLKEYKDLKLILQPMKSTEKLRNYLYKNGYRIVKEKAVESNSKFYSVMEASVGLESYDKITYSYIGKIFDNKPRTTQEKYAVIMYSQKEVINLKNRLKGLEINNKKEEAEKLIIIIKEIEREIKTYNE